MYALRPISFGDVVNALQRGEIVQALRISSNLCSNTVGSLRSSFRTGRLRRWGHRPLPCPHAAISRNRGHAGKSECGQPTTACASSTSAHVRPDGLRN